LRAKTLIVVLLVAAGIGTASAQNLEKALNDRYKDKVLALRKPTTSGHVTVDSADAIKTDVTTAPWTMYGRIQVERVRIEQKRLELRGRRIVYLYDQKDKAFEPHKADSKVAVTFRLEKPLTSTEEADALLGKVFALTPEEVVSCAPEYWQHYLKMQSGLSPARVRDEKMGKEAPEDLRKRVGGGEPSIYSVGNGVSAPRVIAQPEPQFSSEARNTHFQGTVGLDVIVNREGRIAKALISRPAGMGLDEQAIEALKSWRFHPATRNGEPVAVVLYIETDFHFYP
jgi:TonB family protein